MRLKTLKAIESGVNFFKAAFIGLLSFYVVMGAAMVWEVYFPGTYGGVVVLGVLALAFHIMSVVFSFARRRLERQESEEVRRG